MCEVTMFLVYLVYLVYLLYRRCIIGTQTEGEKTILLAKVTARLTMSGKKH
jgi:hypothetical protein